MTTDREFIDAAAKGLPIEPEPWKELSERLGISQEEAIARTSRLIAEKKVRRFSASVRHQPMGFSYNAMVIARAEPGRAEEIGLAAAAIDEVSHCYQRPHPDGDPDCVYIMMHARDKETVDRAVERIRRLPGLRGIEVCASLGELKKTSLSGVSSSVGRDEDF